jgi:hypothetical protein
MMGRKAQLQSPEILPKARFMKLLALPAIG